MSHDFAAMLKALQLKVTPKRLALLRALAASPTFKSPDELHRALQGELVRIGLPTVYRNLEEMADGGLVSRVLHPNRQLYYFFCPNRDHHHHFVCLSCRSVADVECCGVDEMARRLGGRVFSHVVQANGLCRDCVVAGREVAA